MERTLNHLTTLQELRVTILGAGNVATHLAKTFSQQGAVLQIYNHNIAGAKTLAETIGATYTASLDEIWPDADLCIISVKDDAVAGLAHSLAGHGGVWAHTSGSVEMEALAPISDSYGVFYPMQTFSKSMDVDMTEVPFFIEGSTEATTEFLKGIASQLSHKVYETDSHRRALLHIAAVFACNFTNRLWDISASVL